MISPAHPLNELRRQEAVNSYQLLDTPAELSYDSVTQLAASICETPVALLTLLDGERNWFKSKIGVPFEESPRAISFCGHAIKQPNDIMIINDARQDTRFADNPLVAEMKAAIFYCGVPIKSSKGLPLGTLCVFDDKPRRLNAMQISSMKALAFQAEQLFELRRQYLKAERYNNSLKVTNDMLSNFAAVAAHDLKLPLASIILTTDILKSKYKEVIDLQGIERLDLIKKCSFTLNNYITSMLEYYSSDAIGKKEFEAFNLKDMLHTVLHMMLPENTCEFTLPKGTNIINTNELALIQIFSNLIGNSLKYCDKPQCKITIGFHEDHQFYHFNIKDNSRGIPRGLLPTVFDIFTTATETDNQGNAGSGIGLSTVKRLVKSLNGEIDITSSFGEWTNVKFTIKKPSKANPH